MIDKECLFDITDRFPTPLFVFDEDELTGRTYKIRDILGDIPLCFSIKANPFLIPSLINVVDRFEVCSPGELAICKKLSVSPEKIIYSGVHKEAEDIEDAILTGAGILTAESIRHYRLIKNVSERLGQKTCVLLRLNSKSQFGMSPADIETVLSDPSPNIDVIGLHYFAGTGRKKTSKLADELLMLEDTICSLRNKYDTPLPMLEYGPGLPFPYFTDDDFSDTLRPLKDLLPYLEKISGKCSLSVEMGRFIASSCGYYLTSICDIKNASGSDWCIVDGGINHVNYLGQMMGMKTPVIRHMQGRCIVDDSDGNDYCICGSLCSTNDVLVRSLPLKGAGEGDILVFENIGAYSVTEAMGLFLSRTLPRIVMCKENTPQLVRDAKESWMINIQDM
ncbi:MAG: diaminopimelate decarboxylase [Lachnospiraceae bacterium]|nr:diaminopimelate decarboxylase [Lachnospiraceae bacterium]